MIAPGGDFAAYPTPTLAVGNAEHLMAGASRTPGLPVTDPMRGGPAFNRLFEACLTR
jgi:hypothetical protein